MTLHELAGKPVPREMLVNVPRLVSAYYTRRPDPANPAERVSFGTSGHRGSSLKSSFNEAHVLAIVQAVCELRAAARRTGPLFLGMDTHALSEPAFASALEVLAANGVETMIQAGRGYTPTPVISHAILAHHRGRAAARNSQTACTMASTCASLKEPLYDEPRCPEVPNETRSAGFDASGRPV